MTRPRLRADATFPVVAAVLGFFLAAASAPSPLYALYAAQWGFPATTLTLVFAVYVFALLVALLTTGTLSDHLGRRPVVLGALVVQCAAMAAFLLAGGVAGLYLARVLQGAATGVVTAAAAAWLLESEPAAHAGWGAVVNSVMPTAGLAVGGLAAGALVQYGPDPLHLVYVFLLAAFLLLTGSVAALREPARDRPPLTAAVLRPRLALAAPLRGPFLALLPCLVATWALGGLYLSLGPSIVLSLEHSTNRLLGGIAVFLLCGAGAVASVALRGWPPRRGVLVGCALLAGGVLVSVAAVAASATVVYLVGSTVAGAGFGCAFLSAFRALTGRAAPADRGGLIATIYVASYLAFSLPALVAGVATVRFGLRPTALGYGVFVAVLALLAVALTARRPAPAQRST